MRILYLTQWFEPEPNIVKGLAFVRALQGAGHEVTVVTGFPNYPTGRLYPGYRLRPIGRETVEGVSVVRLPLYPSHDASSLRRSLNFLSFFVSSAIYCASRAGRFDLIYAYHPPITVGLAAAIAGWLRRVPFVLDVQDLWPDTLGVSGMRGAARLSRPIGLLCRLAYRAAAAIIAQSVGMARMLSERGGRPERIQVIHNWATRASDPPAGSSRTARAERRFTIVYGGNFGRAQGLETVIEAARLVSRQADHIEVRLIGEGVDAARLRELAASVPGLRIEPAVSQEEIETVFARADALLLHLRDEPLFRVTIPSKVQAYLSSGRPIVAAIAGEAADLLGRSQAALVAPPQDPQALAAAIQRIAAMPGAERDRMGAAGRRFYLAEFSFERGIERTLAVIAAAHEGFRSRTPMVTA